MDHLDCFKQYGFNPEDGIYRSRYPSPNLPQYPHLGFIQHMLFRNAGCLSQDHKLVDATSDKSLSSSQVRNALHSISHSLVCILGIKQGDVVMVMAGNTLYVPVIVNAIIYIGAVVTTINPASTVREIVRQAQDAKPNLIVTYAETLHKVESLALPVVVLEEDESSNFVEKPGVIPFSKLLLGDPSWVPNVRIRQTDTAALLYTSGTTGTNKGVMLSHGNFIAAVEVMKLAKEKVLQDDDVVLSVFPLFHIAGFALFCYRLLTDGPRFIMHRKYELPRLLKSIERYGATRLIIAPLVIVDMLKEDCASKFNLTTVRTIAVGSAPLGLSTMDAFQRKFPHIKNSFQAFGMTEISIGCCGGYGPVGGSGRLLPGFEAKVVNIQSGEPMPPDNTGELCIRSPCIMQGYLNNPKATSEAIDEDGWLHSGDLVYFNTKGFLFVVDRIKELIKYKGFQVAPSELESLLRMHNSVVDCAVVPYSDERAGQIPVAVIVRSRKSNLTGNEIMEYVANQVSPHKKIRRVVFVDHIPKSAVGKPLRRELVQIVQSKL